MSAETKINTHLAAVRRSIVSQKALKSCLNVQPGIELSIRLKRMTSRRTDLREIDEGDRAREKEESRAGGREKHAVSCRACASACVRENGAPG